MYCTSTSTIFRSPCSAGKMCRYLTTIHGRLDLPELVDAYGTYPDCTIRLDIQQPAPADPAPQLGAHRAPRHAGQSADATTGQAGIRSVSRPHLSEKGVDRAIRIAGKAGMKLKIAAKVDNADKEYYDSKIKPLIQGNPDVEFIGEINDAQKPDFLSGAHALIFPIDWPEPFGLVMIEAMACGTPIIAYNCGSVPEVMDDGLTGFIVNNIDEAVAAVGKIHTLDRARVRATFDRRFTARRMAEDYVDVYEELAQPVRHLQAVPA